MKSERMYCRSILCLLLVSVLLFISCQNGKGGETGTDDRHDIPSGSMLTLFGGEDDFRIIYSNGAGNALRQAITELKSKIKGTTGKNPTVSTDGQKQDPKIKEVLIGNTTRTESKTVLATVDYVGWKICVENGNLVIHGSDDSMVIEAIDNLQTLWQAENGAIRIANDVSESRNVTEGRVALIENGKFRYRIVCSATVSETVERALGNLTATLVKATGNPVEKEYDSVPKGNTEEILIGQTNRAGSEVLYGLLESQFEYRIAFYSGDLMVGALSQDALLAGIADLTEVLTNAVSNCYNGMPSISADFFRRESISETAGNLPVLTAGTLHGIYNEGNNSHILYYKNVSAQDYTDYCAKLLANGCEKIGEYALTDNRYTLFANENYSAYVSYLPKVDAIRVFVGKPTVKYPAVREATAAGDGTPTLWQLEVATKEEKSNGGMSYVIRLSDGTFLIVDGGFNCNAEGDRLYQLLRDNTPEGQKPVIAGWFISHLHGDHYGGLQQIANRYSDKVDVQAFYYNFPEVASGKTNTIGSGLYKNVEVAMSRWSTAVRYSKLHSGMTIGFAGAKVTVIATHEDVYPLTIEDGNDTSTVIRLDIAGQRILFLADAYYNEESTMLSTISAADLKCDIVQVSHHGYEGCSNAFYQTTGAAVVLWPMNIDGYQTSGYSSVPQAVFKQWYNKGMNSYLRTSGNVKKILLSGAGTVKLTLPYDCTAQTVTYIDQYGVERPATGRLIDYDAIYTQRTS